METKPKKRSYLDSYKDRIEELSQKGVGVASLARLLTAEAGFEVPYNSLINYMKRRGIQYYKG